MKEQDKAISPLAKGTSYFLIYLTGIYPLNSAVAGGITPDNTQTQIHNNDNVPVVNIATPNNAGISHNTYHEFNTEAQGAVLNNATQAMNSQLAGQISANANLQGKAAELIINEVTGSNRSELLGQLEVAGQKANVMIANPNGITCDGCGFINTSGAILTTGKPQFDAQDALEALTVTKGQITIGGKGLNGQSTDYVDIISRATELNGKIQANNLTLTQGANQISFKNGTSKTIAGEGAAPQLAVDTKALGGMYANKIRLIATEDGVGVNLKDITSTQGDITLNANGRMELGAGKITSAADIKAEAKELYIKPTQFIDGDMVWADDSIYAKQDILLTSRILENSGGVKANRDMRVFGNKVHNIGLDAILFAKNNMWIQKNAQGEKSDLIENNSASISSFNGKLNIKTKKLINTQDYYFELAEEEIKKKKNTADVLGDLFIENQAGSINSGNDININSDKFINKNGKIHSYGELFLNGNEFKHNRIFKTLPKDNLFNEDENGVIEENGSKSIERYGIISAKNGITINFPQKIEIADSIDSSVDSPPPSIMSNGDILLNGVKVPVNDKHINGIYYRTGIHPQRSEIIDDIESEDNQDQESYSKNVPVINIARPNDSGVSHNIFKEFNIDPQGMVLNNSTNSVSTQLAGQIDSNANLQHKAAELIINEVTESNHSELRGQLEVAGQKANVMIANPNGITCDECEFINTTGAILTTGKPQFDTLGALEVLKVTKGQIMIGGKGLNGQSTDYIDIISRATELNGGIQANNLTFTQGANQISFKDGTSKTMAGEGETPLLAVDIKTQGGMHANKIRLIATENSVGVNLKNITSTQGDITLSANGKMELGSIKAKTDLNVGAKEINIGPNSPVQAERDIAFAGSQLNTKSSVTAGQDMRIYVNELYNIGNDALLQANNNMWIQKNAEGDKNALIENRSGTIKTNKGDLVARTNRINNMQDYYFTQRKLTEEELKEKKRIEDKERKEKEECKEFCFDFSSLSDALDKWEEKPLERGRVLLNLKPSTISSGSNIYINGDILNNINSNIFAEKDIFLTGNELKNSRIFNSVNIKGWFGSVPYYSVSNSPMIPSSTYEYYADGYGNLYKKDSKSIDWYDWDNKHTSLINKEEEYANYVRIIKDFETENTSISAKGNLVSDFHGKIEIINKVGEPYHKVFDESFPSALSAKNILLNSKGNIFIKDKLKSLEDTNIISENNISIIDTSVNALKDLSVVAVDKIRGISSKLKGENITLNSYKGDIIFRNAPDIDKNKDISVDYDTIPVMFGGRISPYGAQAELNSLDNLTIYSGNDLSLREVIFSKNKNVNLTANNINIVNKSFHSICIEKCNESGSYSMESTYKQEIPYDTFIKSSESINMTSKGSINLEGVTLSTDGDISLSSIRDINLLPKRDVYEPYMMIYRQKDGRSGLGSGYFDYIEQGYKSEELGTRLFAKNGLLSSEGNIMGSNIQANIKNDLFIYAGDSIRLFAGEYKDKRSMGDHYEDHKSASVSNIHSGNNLTLSSNNVISTIASKLSSGRDLTLSSGGDIGFEAFNSYSELNDFNDDKNGFRVHTGKSLKTISQPTELSSNGNLSILSQGSLLFQATKLAAKGAMNIAAKGGYLYAQAQEDISEYTTKETKRKWYGKKKSMSRTHHDVTNKVTEFVAGGDINLLSHDDSTYEASKIETNNNATLTSTHGKVNFKAVKNTVFDQTITESKGFFIKNGNSGHSAETWILPSVHIGGKLTIDAADGINADIKTQKGQSLQAALAALGDTPETAWLKGLNQRQDVHWNEVQDAYESWNYQDQHLNPAVSAAIAIAVAVVTAGAGITVAAAGYAAGAATTVGASAATAAAVGGAVTAGMASLASTAAVKLINNGGNISKTLKEMGNSETVKSTATSMAIGGALAGFDNLIGVEKTANGATKAPLLSNKADWSKVAQRVAGQSVISSSLNTAINGGSFKDNFAAALLTNVGNQINAEGANIIGNNGAVLGAPGKAISHAAVSALAAEIGGGDAKGAAAGALAAELATVVMESSLFESKYRNEPERQFHKIQEAIQGNEAKAQTVQVIGALSGALISGTPEGVYSAANSADLVYRYNYTEHQWDQIFQENGRDIAAAANGDKAAAERVAARQDGAIAALAVAGGAYVTVAGGYILAAATEEMLFAGRMAFEACKVQGSFCINKMGIFVADAMAPEAALGTGALGAGTVKILGYSSESAKNLANELNHASTALLSKNQKPNTHAVTGLIEQEAKRALENYRVYDLNKVTDKALDLNLVRQETLKYLKASHQKNDKAVSYATASVDTNGITEYYLSVSGKAWSGSSPTTVNIGGVNYKVILTDSESIPSIGIIKTQKTNLNHAEQKLFSYIQDNYNGQKANVNISVQNTSIMEPGMCIGCGYTSQNFAEMNKNFNVNIFQGSTGANP